MCARLSDGRRGRLVGVHEDLGGDDHVTPCIHDSSEEPEGLGLARRGSFDVNATRARVRLSLVVERAGLADDGIGELRAVALERSINDSLGCRRRAAGATARRVSEQGCDHGKEDTDR